MADLGIALEHILSGYVEFTVVGDRTDPRAGRLHQAALEVYEPRKIVHFEVPGRYPDQGQPALFVCSETACSSPIKDPTKVAAVAQRFAAVDSQ